jgi:hypothetical protein
MGGHFYWYVVDYQNDIAKALNDLREREFSAGRYYPVFKYPDQFLSASPQPAPGAKHRSIADAMRAAAEEGTRSILDLDRIAPSPRSCAVTRLDGGILLDLYGTTEPTREMVEPDFAFSEYMERGEGVYIILYEGGKPRHILFAGYSFD